MGSRALHRLRRQRILRRILIAVLALALIALTASGLVWVLESFRGYAPTHYEPKDMERERYEIQRRLSDGKPGS
jgi:hypothetical protein